MTTAERRARVALGRLTEPGDPRLAALVAELGATVVHEHLASERDLGGLRTDIAERLEVMDPERDLAQAEQQGIRFVIPGDDEWPTQLDDAGAGRAGPGSWRPAAGAVGARTAAAVSARGLRRGGRLALRHDVRRRRRRRGRRPRSPDRGERWSPAPRSASTPPPTAGRCRPTGATVAVLACGADRVYPAAHRPLLDHLARHGAAIVSEAPPGAAPPSGSASWP